MKKIKTIFIGLLSFCMLVGIIPCSNVQAVTNDTVAILPQYLSSRACDHGNLFYDAIAVDIANVHPKYTYDIYYRRHGSKKYRFYKTYTEHGKNQDDCDFWDNDMILGSGFKNYRNIHRMWLTRTSANTRYYIKVKTRETGRWSKTESFWSAAKNPKYKRNGRKLTWNKSKGAAGYVSEYRKYVWYEWHNGVPDYVGDYYTYGKVLSSGKRSYLVPNGYKARGVYSYTKHGKYYYVDGYGCFTNKRELTGLFEFIRDAYKIRKNKGLNELIYEI